MGEQVDAYVEQREVRGDGRVVEELLDHEFVVPVRQVDNGEHQADGRGNAFVPAGFPVAEVGGEGVP